MIPVDEAARKRDGHFVRDDIPDFVSPIDGTVVSGRKQMADHCRKHGVRPADEYPPEHYAEAAQKRADHYNGVRSKAEIQAQRENINEIINEHERRAANGH
jgi:hypothetical protein